MGIRGIPPGNEISKIDPISQSAFEITRSSGLRFAIAAELVGLLETARALHIDSGVVWRIALATVDDGIGLRALLGWKSVIATAGPASFGTWTCMALLMVGCNTWRSARGSLGLGRVSGWRSRGRLGRPRPVLVLGTVRLWALNLSFGPVTVHGDPILDALFWQVVPSHEVVINMVEALGPSIDSPLLQVNQTVTETAPKARLAVAANSTVVELGPDGV